MCAVEYPRDKYYLHRIYNNMENDHIIREKVLTNFS